MRALIYLCLAVLTASPAQAELRDLRARLSGQEGLVWIAFDGQPTLLRREETAHGVDLVVEGISLEARRITPRHRELVTAIVVEPTEGGARIQLQGEQAWAASEAELRQGGVLVRVHLAEASATITPAMPASAYPATTPDWRPTVTSEPAPVAAPAPASIPLPATPAPDRPEPRAPAALTAPARASAMPAQAGAAAAAALPAELSACAAAAAAVEANPWDDGPLMQHARCLGRAGNPVAAIRIYEQILAFEPENVTAALALADLRVQQGDTEAARALYLRAATHATSDSEAMRARSQAAALPQD
ncbi:tetratricopeptide repeat protein [Maricaulis sp.]|uniref:tetratricopeptide repeat protein n=1 Tax=Maricaulis sp. TaxID=1486257 RepID=UPI003A8F7A58